MTKVRARSCQDEVVTRFWLDGQSVEASVLATNDGLNYGRFDAPGLEVHTYELVVTRGELSAAFSVAFDSLVAEMREDDLHDDHPSALKRMNYPTLNDAFFHPSELEEVIRIFLDREILARWTPLTEASEFVINSTDAIQVTAAGVTLSGRCFRRRRAAP